jgi:predicted enzyme related to lactoylglutathione lyase
MQSGPDQGPPSWTVSFQTPDADATVKASEQAGGGTPAPPMDVMDAGRMAILTDTAGAVFGLWQPGRIKGLELAGAPGSLCWVELYTTDVPKVAAYYRATLGLETSVVPFPGGSYTCVNPADTGDDGMFGGVIDVDEDPTGIETTPYWLPYFEVTGCRPRTWRASAASHGSPTRTGHASR